MNMNLRILISAQDAASQVMSGLTSALGPVGGALVAIGVAAAATAVTIGVTAVKAAADFQTGMTSLVTGAGESQSNLKMVSDGILGLAVSTGTSTKQLTDGMYMIESAGFHGAAGLAVLKASAEGAKVGNADLGTVADATTTIMLDFGLKSGQASVAVNTLIATVANGKTTMQALSGALSQIMPTASAAGVSLNDTAAALATMTGEGVPAANAATYLRQTILGLEAPSAGTVKALKSVGLTSAEVSDEMKKSLPDALQMITEAVGKKFPVGSAAYVAAIKNISGGAKTMQGMLDLTGTHLATFKGNVTNIADAVKHGGNSITGWSLVQQTFNFKMQQAHEAVETLMIKIGQALLPVMTRLMGQVAPLIQRFSDWLVKSGALNNMASALAGGLSNLIGFITNLVTVGMNLVSFFQHNQAAMVGLQAALIAIGIVIVSSIVTSFYMWAAAAWATAAANIAAAWPIYVVVLAIVAVIALVILAVTHWGQIAHFLQQVWGAVASWFMGVLGAIGSFFTGIWQGIANFFVSIWHWILANAQTILTILAAVILGPIGLIAAMIFFHWNQIVGFFRAAWAWIVGIFSGAIQTVVGWFSWLYNHNYYFQHLVDFIRSIITNVVNWLKNIWQTVVGWIVSKWTWLRDMATMYFMAISVEIQARIRQVENIIHSIWANIVSWLQGIWSTITGDVSSAWSKISSIFSSAWGTYVASPLNNLKNSILNFFTGLANTAISWGSNLISGFVSGITGSLGKVTGAVSQIMGKVGGFLGFHSPSKEGPGVELNQWGPNLIRGFTAGMLSQLPALQSTLHMIMSPVQQSLGGGGVHAVASPVAAGGGGGGGTTIVLNLTVNARPQDEAEMEQVAQFTVKHFGDQIRSQYSNLFAGGR